MQADYINPIYQATGDVLQKMFSLDVERGEIELRDKFISTKKANISIGINGDLQGTVLFSFSKEIALKMVENMAGREMNELNKFVTSAIGELANIISGNAMSNFNKEEKYELDIVPPQVIIGASQTISTVDEKVLFIPLETELGEFDLNVVIEQN